MRKISEVMRLKAAGLSVCEITGSSGVHRTTDHEYLARAKAAGLSWRLPPDLNEAAGGEALFPPATVELAARRAVPDWREVAGC
ncbi:MAG: hypothetical protein ACYDAC_01515 [Candidatus Dormibacteria bacterium]